MLERKKKGREYAISAIEDYRENLKLFIDERSARQFAKDFPELSQYRDIYHSVNESPKGDSRSLIRGSYTPARAEDAVMTDMSDPETAHNFGRGGIRANVNESEPRILDLDEISGRFDSGVESNRCGALTGRIGAPRNDASYRERLTRAGGSARSSCANCFRFCQERRTSQEELLQQDMEINIAYLLESPILHEHGLQGYH